jgi:hypothetical protein
LEDERRGDGSSSVAEAWETLHSDTSRPFDRPGTGRIAVKVINHLGDEVMKVFWGVMEKFESAIK